MPELAEPTEVSSFAEAAAQINQAASRGEAAPAPSLETAPAKPAATAPKPAEAAKPEAAKPEAEPKKESTVSKLFSKEKSAETKPAPAADEKPIDWKTAPKEFRERHEKLLGEHKTVAQKAQEYEKRVSEYESKIKEIEAKTGDTSKADLKLVEEYSAKIADYEARIRATDYSQSQEFATLRGDFEKKFNQRYTQAAEDVTQFQIKTGEDASGVAITRAATANDLNGLLNKPIGEQRRLARELFGADSDVVIRHLERLKEVRDDWALTSNTKLEEARTQGELRTKEQRLQEQKSQNEYTQHLENFRKQIEAEMPEIFTEPKDDPEAAKAFQSGKEFVTATLANMKNMTPQDRAERNAASEAMLAAFPLLRYRESKHLEKIESLTKELEALRGSDPGSGGNKPAPAAKADDDDLTFAKVEKIFNTPA